MKLVYVAGPFRAKNSWLMERNIRNAETLALKVWKAGFACICPHTNTRFFQGAGPDKVWLDGDLEMVKRCDAVLMTHDWKKSSGATAELNYALNLNIPVFYSIRGLKAGLKGD